MDDDEDEDEVENEDEKGRNMPAAAACILFLSPLMRRWLGLIILVILVILVMIDLRRISTSEVSMLEVDSEVS